VTRLRGLDLHAVGALVGEQTAEVVDGHQYARLDDGHPVEQSGHACDPSCSPTPRSTPHLVAPTPSASSLWTVWHPLAMTSISEPDAPVLCDVAGGVATVTLNRPTRMNAWTYAMEVAYFDLVDALDDDPAVRAVVLTGAGRGFCPGLDAADLS